MPEPDLTDDELKRAAELLKPRRSLRMRFSAWLDEVLKPPPPPADGYPPR